MNRKLRVLSLDGGGIRGIISAKILNHIETMLKVEYGQDFRLGNYFDIVTGTSTGGIITCLLLLKDDDGNLIYDTSDILDLYLTKNSQIFKKRFWHKIKTVFGFFGSEFETKEYERLLDKYFGDKTLKDLKYPSIICSYDTERRACILFKQHYAIQDESYNFYLKDVVRGTTAAPTYFTPVKIKSITNEEYTLIDGGVYANNPTMCALVEINKIFRKENGRPYGIHDIKILSIGTGNYDTKYPWYKIIHWGIIKWIQPFIDISMSATNEVTEYQIRKVYEYNNSSENYLRLSVELNKNESSMDNIKKNNVENLISIGNNMFSINKESIKKFIDL